MIIFGVFLVPFGLNTDIYPSLYLVPIQVNMKQKNSEYGHVLRGEKHKINCTTKGIFCLNESLSLTY